jgi:hypothetical protein
MFIIYFLWNNVYKFIFYGTMFINLKRSKQKNLILIKKIKQLKPMYETIDKI